MNQQRQIQYWAHMLDEAFGDQASIGKDVNEGLGLTLAAHSAFQQSSRLSRDLTSNSAFQQSSRLSRDLTSNSAFQQSSRLSRDLTSKRSSANRRPNSENGRYDDRSRGSSNSSRHSSARPDERWLRKKWADNVRESIQDLSEDVKTYRWILEHPGDTATLRFKGGRNYTVSDIYWRCYNKEVKKYIDFISIRKYDVGRRMFGMLKDDYCLFDVTGPECLIMRIFDDYFRRDILKNSSAEFNDYIVDPRTGTCKAYGKDGLVSDEQAKKSTAVVKEKSASQQRQAAGAAVRELEAKLKRLSDLLQKIENNEV